MAPRWLLALSCWLVSPGVPRAFEIKRDDAVHTPVRYEMAARNASHLDFFTFYDWAPERQVHECDVHSPQLMNVFVRGRLDGSG
eukprot:COSAG02_NODE_482_length_21409_cov_126.131018_19_plen_84_part_00